MSFVTASALPPTPFKLLKMAALSGNLMLRWAIVATLWLAIPSWYAAAASITAELCGKKCLLPSYDHVEIRLLGPIKKGDLANLLKEYATPAKFACLNRIEPGRYVTMTPDEFKALQKAHQVQTSNVTQPARSAAEEQCWNNSSPNRPGYLNGMLVINSAGGDLDEAMAIGRWIRQNRIGVMAVNECASACVWILAAGFDRNVLWDTKILVHRPYLTSDNPGGGERLQKLLHQSKDYFDTMGVPPELAERMFSTPSDDATELTKAQISYYRLDQASFEFQQELDTVRAKNLGISKDEYILRRQKYNNLSKLIPCSTLIKSQDENMIIHELNECENDRLKAFGLEK